MFSNLLFSYEIKYHVSYIKQNSPVLVTTCKRSHLDKINRAPVGSFRVCIDKQKKPCISNFSSDHQPIATLESKKKPAVFFKQDYHSESDSDNKSFPLGISQDLTPHVDKEATPTDMLFALKKNNFGLYSDKCHTLS